MSTSSLLESLAAADLWQTPYRSLDMTAVLAPLLLDAAIKGVIIMALTATATLAMRRSSAAARHLVWLLGAASLLLLPILSAALPGWYILPNWTLSSPVGDAPLDSLPLGGGQGSRLSPIGITGTEAFSTPTPAPANSLPLETRQPVVQQVRSSPPAESAPSAPLPLGGALGRGLSWQTWLLLIWLTPASLLLAYILLAALSLRRLEHRSSRVTAGDSQRLLEELRAQLRLRRPVDLLSHPGRSMPMTWGLWRTRLLLPADALGARPSSAASAAPWNPEQLRSVLLHELAHARRWDCLSQLIVQLACALHWFNPLVWFAWHRMQIERERACDDLVLSTGTRASAYAQQLLHIASDMPATRYSAAAIAMARPSSLEGRLLAILDVTRDRRTVRRWVAAGSLVLFLGVAAPLAMLRAASEAKPVDREAIPIMSAATKPAVPIFGPVIQRELDSDPDSKAFAIDLDTGKLYPPLYPSLGKDARERPVKAAKEWADRTGIDAALDDGLVGFQLVWVAVDSGGWDSIRASSISARLADHEPATPSQLISNNPGATPTFVFKTREGSTGILQIVRHSDNGGDPDDTMYKDRMTLRYKLVQDVALVAAVPTTQTAPPATRALATLPNGVSIELVGIAPAGPASDATAAPPANAWFSPTGLPVAPPYTSLKASVRGLDAASADRNAAFVKEIRSRAKPREFAFALHGLERPTQPSYMFSWPGRAEQLFVSEHSVTYRNDGRGEDSWTYTSLLTAFYGEALGDRVNIRVALASGPFKTGATAPMDRASTQVLDGSTVILKRPTEMNGHARFDIEYDPAVHDIKVVAVSRSGKPNDGYNVGTFGPANDPEHPDFRRDLVGLFEPLFADIDHLVIQTRTIEWAEFRKVPLKAGLSNALEIATGSAADRPATQPTEQAPTTPAAAPHTIALYLVTKPAQSPQAAETPLSQLQLATDPLFTESEIRSYNWSTHTLRLKHGRSPTINGLNDNPFVLVVDGQRVYCGQFIGWGEPVSGLASIQTGLIDDRSLPSDAIRIVGSPNAPLLKQALQDLNLLEEKPHAFPPPALHTVTYHLTVQKSDQTAEAGRVMHKDGRERMEMPDGTILIRDAIAGKGMLLDPEHKTASISTLENVRPDGLPFASLEKMIEPGANPASSVGKKQIAGKEAEGIRFTAGVETRTVWRDVASGRLLQFETEISQHEVTGSPVQSVGPLHYILSDIVFDAPLDDSLFVTEPPPGYQRKEGATVRFEAVELGAVAPATQPPTTQPATLHSGRLDFRILMNRGQSLGAPWLSNDDVKKLLAEFAKHGPTVGQILGADRPWLPLNPAVSAPASLPVAAQWHGRWYVMGNSAPEHTMLANAGGRRAWGLVRCYVTKDALNQPAIGFEFDQAGAARFRALTGAHIGHQLAAIVDGQVVMVATINTVIGSSGIITNQNMTEKAAADLAAILQRGMPALTPPVPTVAAANTSPSETFGPQREFTLPAARRNERTPQLRLADGALLTPPVDLDQWQQPEAWSAWIKAQRLDLQAVSGSTFYGLMGYDMAVMPIGSDFLPENNSAGQLRQLRSFMKPPNDVLLSAAGQLPIHYAIQTRDGTMGLLTIVALTDNPRGVKIRYSLLSSSTAATQPGINHPPTLPASSPPAPGGSTTADQPAWSPAQKPTNIVAPATAPMPKKLTAYAHDNKVQLRADDKVIEAETIILDLPGHPATSFDLYQGLVRVRCDAEGGKCECLGSRIDMDSTGNLVAQGGLLPAIQNAFDRRSAPVTQPSTQPDSQGLEVQLHLLQSQWRPEQDLPLLACLKNNGDAFSIWDAMHGWSLEIDGRPFILQQTSHEWDGWRNVGKDQTLEWDTLRLHRTDKGLDIRGTRHGTYYQALDLPILGQDRGTGGDHQTIEASILSPGKHRLRLGFPWNAEQKPGESPRFHHTSEASWVYSDAVTFEVLQPPPAAAPTTQPESIPQNSSPTRAASQPPATAVSGPVAVFRNGVRVELLGICSYPPTGKQWWTYNGQLLPSSPPDLPDLPMLDNGNVPLCPSYLFALRSNNPGNAEMKWRFDSVHGTMGPSTSNGISWNIAQFMDNRDIATLRVGTPLEPWTTIVTTSGKESTFGVRGHVGGHIETLPSDGGIRIQLSHDFADREARLLVLTTDNNAGIPFETNDRRQTYSFPLKRESIREIRFQTCRFEWKQFKDVALRPATAPPSAPPGRLEWRTAATAEMPFIETRVWALCDLVDFAEPRQDGNRTTIRVAYIAPSDRQTRLIAITKDGAVHASDAPYEPFDTGVVNTDVHFSNLPLDQIRAFAVQVETGG